MDFIVVTQGVDLHKGTPVVKAGWFEDKVHDCLIPIFFDSHIEAKRAIIKIMLATMLILTIFINEIFNFFNTEKNVFK